MVLPAGQSVHARHRHEPDRRDDRRSTHPRRARCGGWVGTRLISAFLALFTFAAVAGEEPVRVLTFNTELARKGPGLLVRDLMGDLSGEKSQDIALVVAQLVQASPDIAVLQGIDFDHDLVALGLLHDHLKAAGLKLPHMLALRPNTGRDTGFDLDRNGRLGQGRDKHGFGYFNGQGGLAILSRHPILHDDVRDFTSFLWQDLPEPRWPDNYFSSAEKAALRLHAVAAWDVPIMTPDGVIYLLTSHASPPVFDGPENRNGLRNSDEIGFWRHYISGDLPAAPRGPHYIVIGDFNADPVLGEGAHDEINALRGSALLQDPSPDDRQGLQHTVVWPDGPGALRVDYILPSRSFAVQSSRIHRSAGDGGEFASRHAPVSVDLLRQ